MSTLRELLVKYDTDKDTLHSYGRFYEAILTPKKDHVWHLLEIGLRKGESIRVWQEFFPAAQIWGLDNEEECELPKIDSPNVHLYHGDQCNPSDLYHLVAEMKVLTGLRQNIVDSLSVVIDDGCHDPYAQIATFGALWPHMGEFGLYIIEDVENIRVARRLQQMFGGHIEDFRDEKGRYDDVIWWKQKE